MRSLPMRQFGTGLTRAEKLSLRNTPPGQQAYLYLHPTDNMKIYLKNQTVNFLQQLEYLKQQPVIPYDLGRLIEKTYIVEVNNSKSLEEMDTGFFFDYRIFPEHILSHLTQWKAEHRNMMVGDTIVQQVYIPPHQSYSQKLIFGVRINEIVEEATRIGYSYETLVGHVEMGVSLFTIEKKEDGKTIFKIKTFSRPGSLLTRLLGPVFSVPYQAYCTRQALVNVKRQLEAMR